VESIKTPNFRGSILLVQKPVLRYNYGMDYRIFFLRFCILSLLIPACSGNPKSFIEKPQYSQWYYTYTVLLTPEYPCDSPKLEIALSLFQVKYPPEQAAFVNQVLYSTSGLDSYKDLVVMEQRENYRKSLSYLEDLAIEELLIFDSDGFETEDLESSNWRHTEKFAPICPKNKGIIIERTKETYSGGAHGMRTKRYFVIDLEEQKLLKIDDFFDDYQGDRMRDLIYKELRKYSGLGKNQPLSEGIFLNDEPELTFNFFLNEEGLGLHWDPYEITPYAEGSVQIILPWKEIRPMLLNSGMELLTKFNIYLFV
jgi:hypothetical protein